MAYVVVKTEKIGIVDLFRLKRSSGNYYLSIEPKIIDAFNLRAKDLLTVEIKNVKRTEQGSGKKPVEP